MATKPESRKLKKKKEELETMDPKVKISKDEYAVAKWMRANVPKKKTKFLSHAVEYFTASKALDLLMKSSWAQAGKNEEEAFFPTREAAVEFLDLMLRHKFFHRARKIPISEEELKLRAKRKEKKKDKEKEKEKEKSEEEEKQEAESSHAEEKKDKDKSKVKKEKRKIRLDMHLEQVFVDCSDAYVWIYDPIPYYYWIAGTGVVLATVALCLFPLWPPSVRKGVYYLSVAAAGFLVFILGLAVLRLVLFSLLWLVTMGRHHFWLLPNLTEDVGFFASFWPLWKYEYKGDDASGKKKGKGKKRKEKLSDDDEDAQQKETEKSPGEEQNASEQRRDEASESESESSQKSQTGADFEIVDKDN